MNDWKFEKVDQDIVNQLQSVLPSKLFDIHAHIYRQCDLFIPGTNVITEGPNEVGVHTWRDHIRRQIGRKKLIGGLIMGYPCVRNLEAVNKFTLSEAKRHKGCHALLVVSPKSSKDEFLKLCKNSLVKGFKPFHTMSKRNPTFDAQIDEYLPEWVWQLSDERQMVILLHLVRYEALSDGSNSQYIQQMCRKYPNAQLVLSHCGRGFHAPNTVKGIAALRGLQNVWFDTAGLCETAAITAVLEEFGPNKLMWGTDFPVSEQRGRFTTIGDGFAFIYPSGSEAAFCHPALTGIESLRAVTDAAANYGLNKIDLENIFCNNALSLLAIEQNETDNTQNLYERAKIRIPVVAANQWPGYASEARGCEVWNIDGRHYYDISTEGIGSCLLGFRDPDVTLAVKRRINLGSMSSLNPPEEVELADMLCEIHPWAQQVRFGRCAVEAAALAVRIARATTDRSIIAICGCHNRHDWYLAANPAEDDSRGGHLLSGLDPLGIPNELRGTAYTFEYNDKAELLAILDQYGDKLAAVVMEPCKYYNPEPGFLEFVRKSAHKHNALLIFDEITIGWRLHYGGAHLKFGVDPDIAVFAKTLGNGHPIAAIIGTTEAMAGAQSSFIGSTYWTESVGPAAALATLQKMKNTDMVEHVSRVGSIIKESWKMNADKTGVPVIVDDGFPCLAHFRFKHELESELSSLYTQLMLKQGFLAGCSIYPTLAHNDEVIEKYDRAVGKVFAEIADAIDSNTTLQELKGVCS